MSTRLLLRIAAVITLLFCAGHTAGIPWTPAAGPAELPVINAMKGTSFDVVGSMRTYWDLYYGFGVTISFLLLLIAVILWQLADLSGTYAFRSRPMIVAVLIFFVINAVLALKYFFIIPLAMSVAIAAVL